MIDIFFRMASAPTASRWIASAKRGTDWLALLGQVNSERRQLRSLDDRLLRDIGVNRADAERESNRAYWDVPSARLPDQPSSPAPEPTNPMVFIRPMS